MGDSESIYKSLLCGTVTGGLDYMMELYLTNTVCREAGSRGLGVKEHSTVLDEGRFTAPGHHSEFTRPLNYVFKSVSPQIHSRCVLKEPLGLSHTFTDYEMWGEKKLFLIPHHQFLKIKILWLICTNKSFC